MPEKLSVPVSKPQPSMNMIVRHMRCTPRRTIRTSQGGFQEPGFLNRFLSKFLCRPQRNFMSQTFVRINLKDSMKNENFSYQLGCCQRLLDGQKSPTCPKGTSSPAAHSANPRRQPSGFLRIFPETTEALRRGNHIRRSAFVTGRVDGKVDSPSQFV